MPCRGPDDNELYHEASNRARGYKSQLDYTTRLLCEICRELEKYHQPMSDPLKKWWDSHKEIDERRYKAEKARKLKEQEARLARIEKREKKAAALAKLTEEDKRILGH